MARNSLTYRVIRVFGLLAMLAIVASLLLACGEAEDIGGNAGGGDPTPVVTPTPDVPVATPTPEAPVVTPTPEAPTATPEPPTATPGPADPRVDYPTGSDDLVLRIEHVGGFVMMEHLMTRLPVISLTGDGCFVYEGPQIMIYPAPALPNLLVTCVAQYFTTGILSSCVHP
jgi:hypothetical protein